VLNATRPSNLAAPSAPIASVHVEPAAHPLDPARFDPSVSVVQFRGPDGVVLGELRADTRRLTPMALQAARMLAPALVGPPPFGDDAPEHGDVASASPANAQLRLLD
jgi:hypothetical protein